MFCNNCGTQMEVGGVFCGKCGHQATAPPQGIGGAPPPAIPPAFNAVPQGQTAPAAAKALPKRGFLRKSWKIIVPAVVMVAASVVIALLIIGAEPLVRVARATDNFQAEFNQRLETTPLHAVSMVSNALQQGTTTVDFNFRDGWTGISVNGDVSLISNHANRNYALIGNVNAMGLRMDASVFINRDRAAFGSSLLGNENFGFRFDTFRQDFQSFGSMMGLGFFEINMIADVVEALAESMRTDGLPTETYTELLMDFVRSLEPVTSDTQLRGNSVERIEFTIENADIVRFLHQVLDAAQRDANLRSYFDTAGMGFLFDEMMWELRGMVSEIERGPMDIRASLAFYIGSGNRLAQASLNVDMNNRQWNERFIFNATLDLGSHAMDTWRLDMRMTEEWNGSRWDDSFHIEWTYSEFGGRHDHRIVFSEPGGWGNDVNFFSNWDEGSGRFTLGFSDRWDEGSFGGTFNVHSADSFSLNFDPMVVDWDTTLNIGISTTGDAQIRNVDFINIDRWGWTLIDAIEDAMNMLDLFGW
jgi:hypothetical protein